MANDPSGFISGHMLNPGYGKDVSEGTVNNYNLENVNFDLPNVMNYAEFVTELQKDKKFERMIQSMTVGRISGGSKLDKYKYRWN